MEDINQQETIVAIKDMPKTQRPEKTIKRKKPRYRNIGSTNIDQGIARSIPKQLIPTNRIATILGIVFIITIALSLINFPYQKLIYGDTQLTMEIGYPLIFLKLGLKDIESPLQIKNLILDLILYLIIAYIIEVMLNTILEINLIPSKSETKEKPIIFKNIKPSIAEKITKKILKDKTPNPAEQQSLNSTQPST